MTLTAWARLALEGDEPGEGVTRELLDGGPNRSTWRLSRATGETVVAKVFHPRTDRWQRLRRLLHGPLPRAEELRLHRAVRRELPVPFPIGHEPLADGSEVLWLEDLGPVEPLDERFAAAFGLDPEADAARLDLARQAGVVLRDLLAAGVTHGDLHLGNVARHRETGRLHVVDFAKARFQDRPVPLTAKDRRSLFLSFPWPDQAPLRTALAAELGAGPLEPTDDVTGILARFAAERAARCRRSSGPWLVEGAHRARRRPPAGPTTSRTLPAADAVAEFEDRFLLEVHGVPVPQVLALDPSGHGAEARLELEDSVDWIDLPTDARSLSIWASRLEASGHQLHTDDARLCRDPDGRSRVEGLRVSGPRR